MMYILIFFLFLKLFVWIAQVLEQHFVPAYHPGIRPAPVPGLPQTPEAYLEVIRQMADGKDPPVIAQVSFFLNVKYYREASSNEAQCNAFTSILIRFLELGQLEMLLQNGYLLGIFQLSFYHLEFVRQVAELHLKSQAPEAQFNALLTHLFAKYPVPRVMDKAFLQSENKVRQRWYLDMAQGKNLRKSQGLPLKLSNRMVAHLEDVQEGFGILKAFRWAQARGLGASPVLATQLAEGPLGYNRFQNEAFWLAFLKFVVQQAPNAQEVNTMVQYLERVRLARPDFGFKGRSWDRLLEEANRWKALHGLSEIGDLWWSSLGLPTYEQQDEAGTQWFIVELTNQQDLFFEGRSMHHCVSEYAESCQMGESAIFSLRRQSPGLETPKSMATLEVDPGNNSIVETSAKANEPLDDTCKKHVKAWANLAQLSVAL
ncbi:MAG: PcfJ domain-containing protein [Salibacteraceae bacterium]